MPVKPYISIIKLLVADRGEIAVRVIRAARDAGIPSVAVYADSDAAALFVQLADEAFALGGATPAETYLDQTKLLNVTTDRFPFRSTIHIRDTGDDKREKGLSDARIPC